MFEEFKEEDKGLKPIGPENAEIYVLGSFPSERELLMGRCFSGHSGEILNTILEHLDINPDKIRFNYAVNSKVVNESPSDLQINECRKAVFNDIKKAKPKVIIAMGNSALKSLFNRAEPGIYGWRGWQIPMHEFNCWVVPVYPMSKILKDGVFDDNKIQWTKGTNHTDTLRVLREDLFIVNNLVDISIPKPKPFIIKKLLKFEEVLEFFNKANKIPFFVFDYETLGLKPYFEKSCILTSSFTFDGETVYAFPVSYYEHISKKKYWNSAQEQRILGELKQLLINPRSIKAMHNEVFEMEWSKAILDIDIVNGEDSMLQKYILDCRNGTNSLDFLAFVNFGVTWKTYPDSIMADLTQLPLEELLDYNGKDSIWEYRLYKFQEKQLVKNKVLLNCYREQLETAETIAQIQYDGACTNEQSRDNLLKDYKKERERIEQELLNLDSVKEFRTKYGKVPTLKSNSKDIPAILFKIENLDPFKKTDKGNYSVDKEVLMKYSSTSEFCELLLKFREYSGIEGKILKSYTECVFPDGRYHTNFYPIETGRLGSSHINLQNLDKRKHPEIRQIIVAPENHVLLIFDYCLLPDTEYLTQRGWVKILDLQETDQVWQVEKENLNGEFVKPLRIIKKDYDGDVYNFKSYRGELTVTENHRMLWVGQLLHKTKKHLHKYRKETLSQEGVPNSASYSCCFSNSNTVSKYSEREIWIIALLEADSSYDEKYDKYTIQVSLPRKRQKIKELLGYEGTLYEKRDCHKLSVESWSIKFKSDLLKGKKFDLTSLGQNQVKIFEEALCFWDGDYYRYNNTKNKRNYWNSTNLENIEEVQKYFVTNGYECFITNLAKGGFSKSSKHKSCYKISIKEKGTIRFGSINSNLSSIEVIKSKYKGKVGCVTVPTGYILVRSKGQTFVTGNCQLEARVLAALSNCRSFIEMIKTGYDIHMAKAIEIWGEDKIKKATPKEVKAMRYRAKNEFVFPSFYGARPKSVAKWLDISEQHAQNLQDKLWSDFPEIKEWQDNILKIYDKKRYVEIPPGRRRYAPLTINEILNTPVQGGAASIVSKVMNTLRKRGYKIILNCHDELVIPVKEREVRYAIKDIEGIMQTKQYDFMIDVPLIVEGSMGYDWYNVFLNSEIL